MGNPGQGSEVACEVRSNWRLRVFLMAAVALGGGASGFGEDQLTGWQGGQPEAGSATSRPGAVRWDVAKSPAISITFDPPADWSDVGAFRFRIHATEDTGRTITLVVNSDSPQRVKKGVDYYHYAHNIVLNWKGMREFNIPVGQMRPSSTPAGWQQVNRVAFQRVTANEGVVVLDGFRLVRGKNGMDAADRAIFQRFKLRDHPRLLMTLTDERRLKELSATTPLLAALGGALSADADAMLRDPVLEPGAGWKTLNMASLCQLRVHTLALAWRLTGKAAYADRAVKEMQAAAAMPDWSTNQLQIANLTAALAVGYDWLYPQLDPGGRERIRQVIVAKALRPSLAAYQKPEWWVCSDWNWNHVCNGGLILGALAVAEDEPELAAEVIHHARWSLRHGLDGYYPDGAWSEGPDYHRYATTCLALALAGLESAFGTDLDLGRCEGLDKTGLYRIQTVAPTGRYFNYGDCWRSYPAAGPDMFWLAGKFDRPLYAWWQRQVLAGYLERRRAGDPEVMLDEHRFLAMAMALFDTGGAEPTPADLPRDALFRGRPLACFRGEWGKADALYVAIKGGPNANVSHGHLDAGSFILEALGVRWAVDMGPEGYDAPGYFEIGERGRRWTHYLAGSASHNTLVVGGLNQRYEGGGEIVAFLSTPQRAHAVMDLSTAYRGQADKVLRGVAMLDRARVLVCDEIVGLKGGLDLRWGMVTQAEATIRDGTATLRQDGKGLRAEILEPAGAAFEIVPTEKPRVETVMTRNTRMLSIRVSEPKDPGLRIVVLFTPSVPSEKDLPRPFIGPLGAWEKASTTSKR